MLFEIKNGVSIEDLREMQPALLILFSATVLYCKEYSLPCKITSIKGDRENVRAKSRTHEDGRAFDLSTKGWTDMHIHRFLFLINSDYREIGAISASDHNPRAAIYHDYDGQGDHIHLQVKRNANYNKFMKWDFN